MLGSRRHHDWDCPYPRRGYLTVFPPRPARPPGPSRATLVGCPKIPAHLNSPLTGSLSHTHTHTSFSRTVRATRSSRPAIYLLCVKCQRAGVSREYAYR